jgi:hypothetical protein
MIIEIAADVAENCAGALGAVEELLKAGELGIIAVLHTNNLVGRKAYWFWDKVCKRNVSNMRKIAIAIENGLISQEEVHKNLPEDIGGYDVTEVAFFRKLANIES